MLASMASILMLLTISSPWMAAFRDENGSQLSETSEYTKMSERINGIYCPPLGLTDRFKVTVAGSEWSRTGGCSYIQRYPPISPSQLFHLWLRRSLNGGIGHCGDLHNMDHFMFECLSKNRLIVDEGFGNGWQYISLYQHTLFEYYERSKQNVSTRLAYRCASELISTEEYSQSQTDISKIEIPFNTADDTKVTEIITQPHSLQLYKTVNDNPDEIWMAISWNMNADQHTKCEGLLERLEYGPYTHGVQRQWSDGSMLLILTREGIEDP